MALVALGASLSGLGAFGYLLAGDQVRAGCFGNTGGDQAALCDEFLKSERLSLTIGILGFASVVGGIIILLVHRHLSRRAPSQGRSARFPPPPPNRS